MSMPSQLVTKLIRVCSFPSKTNKFCSAYDTIFLNRLFILIGILVTLLAILFGILVIKNHH
jgi:hypothetical protein